MSELGYTYDATPLHELVLPAKTASQLVGLHDSSLLNIQRKTSFFSLLGNIGHMSSSAAFSWLILQCYYTFAAQVLAMTQFTLMEMLLSCATGRTSVDKLTDKMCWTTVSLFLFSDCTADSNLVYTQRLSQTHTHAYTHTQAHCTP